MGPMSDARVPLFERAWLDAVLKPVEQAHGLPGGLPGLARLRGQRADQGKGAGAD